MNVAVVGNSHTVLDQEYGYRIDNCDAVVRCGSLALTGYEKWVGTKTTHWCVSMQKNVAFVIKKFSEKHNTPLSFVKNLTELWTRATSADDETLGVWLEMLSPFDSEISKKIRFAPKRVFSFAEGIITVPSGGLIAVLTAIYRFPKANIFAVGFGDPGQKPISSEQKKMYVFHNYASRKGHEHYYGEKEVENIPFKTVHDFAGEWKSMEGLARKSSRLSLGWK